MAFIRKRRPWDRQPQEAVRARRDRGVIVAHLPGVSGYDVGSGLAPTFGGTAPSNDFRRVIADGMAVEIHPSGGSNGAATIAWPAETISNSDNDLLVIWRGAPKNLSTANGYAFVRGADSGGGGWSIYASFTSATTLVFGVVTTSPGTAGYTATVTDSFTAGELETIAWRLTGGILTGFHQRSGKSSSVSVGQNLRGSSASVLRLGGSTGTEVGGHNISAGLFVVRGSVPDSGVWDAMRNPYECAFEPQTIWVPFSAGGGGGTTISATPGNAVADGTTASVTRTIPATPGNASADGITASVVRVIGAAPGNAAADGTTAAVTRTIATTPGNATADGVTATISTAGTTTISCTPGNASADGALAAITRTIAAAPGNAVANGAIAALLRVIATTPGNAVADGITASIQSSVTISCTPGNAVADGVIASILTGTVHTISVVQPYIVVYMWKRTA